MSNLSARSVLEELVNSGIERRASRERARARAYGSAVSAHESAKVEAVAEVTEAALLATSHVSAIEGLLVAQTPHGGRLSRWPWNFGDDGPGVIVT